MFTTRNRWLLILTAGLITIVTACVQIAPLPLPLPRLGAQRSGEQNATAALNPQVTVVQTVTVEPTATRVAPAPRAVVNQARPTSTPLPQLDPKQLVKARRGDIAALLLLNGRVTAKQETSLSFGTKGIVDQLAVSQGQSVLAGQLLASLDTRDLQQQLSDAQSALQITRLRLQQLQQQTAAQAQALQQAEAQQEADAAKQAAIGQQRAADAVAQAEDQLRIAKDGLARVQAGAAQSDRKAAQAALVTATGNLAKAQTDLAQLQSSPTQADLYAAQQAVATAQIALTKAQADQDKLTRPPDASAVAAAKRDVADAQAAVVALENPVSSNNSATSSTPKMSAAERDQRLQAAQLAVTAAQAHLTEVQKAPDAASVQLAKMAVESTTANLTAAQAHLEIVKAGPTADQISAAQNAVQVAQIVLSGAQAHLDEVNSHPTPAELVDAQAKVAQAQQALDRARQTLDDSTQLATPDSAPASNPNKPGSAASPAIGDSVQIQTLQLQHTVEQQQNQVQTLQDQISASYIRSPYDGVVEAIQLHPGDAADPQKQAFSLASGGAPLVLVDVADGDLTRIATGNAATVQLDGSTTASGTISSIAPNASGSGYTAVVQVSWDDNAPALGSTVQLSITLDQHKGVVLVPQKAIRALGDRRYVEVLDGSDRKQVDVTPGIVSGDDAEIAGGLGEGQIVILPA